MPPARAAAGRYAAAFALGALAASGGLFLARDEAASLYSALRPQPEAPPPGPPGPGTLDWIPAAYLEGAGELGRLSFHRHVSGPGDYPAWREAYVREAGLGRFAASEVYAGRERPEAELLWSGDRGGHALEKYAMPAVDGDRIVFWAVLPAEYRGCVVVTPPGIGHGGARDVVGVESGLSGSYYHDAAAVRIAEGAGCRVYVPENRGFGERQVPSEYCDRLGDSLQTNCTHAVLSAALAAVGVSLLDRSISDAVEVLAWADDGEARVAVGGLSMGARISSAVAAANMGAVDAVFMASGPVSMYALPPSPETLGADLRVGDRADAAAALIPLPLYVSYGRGEVFSWANEARTGATGDLLRRAYEAAGHGGGLTYVVHDGGHRYDLESLVRFIDDKV